MREIDMELLCSAIIRGIDETYTRTENLPITNENKIQVKVGLTDSNFAMGKTTIRRCPLEKQTNTKYKMVYLTVLPRLELDNVNADDRIIIVNCEKKLSVSDERTRICIFDRSVIVTKFADYFPPSSKSHQRLSLLLFPPNYINIYFSISVTEKVIPALAHYAVLVDHRLG